LAADDRCVHGYIPRLDVHQDLRGNVVFDGSQSLDCDQFRDMMQSLRKVAKAVGRDL